MGGVDGVDGCSAAVDDQTLMRSESCQESSRNMWGSVKSVRGHSSHPS